MLSLRSFASAVAFVDAASSLVGCSAATDEDLASMGSSADALGYVVTADKLAASGTQGGFFAFQGNNGLNRGYAIPAPYNQCVPSPFAYKYVASADMVPQSGVESAFAMSNAGSTGFSRLRAALAATGRSLADVSVQFGGFTLRESTFPLAQVNASAHRTETRHYGNGFVRIRLREADGYFYDLLQGTPGDLAMDISYENPANCGDDVIRGEVPVTNLRPYTWGYRTPAAQRVGAALIDDLMHSETAVAAMATGSMQTATSGAAAATSINARPGAPSSQLLTAQRTLVFAFTGMETSVRYSDVRFNTLVGSRFTAGRGSIQAF